MGPTWSCSPKMLTDLDATYYDVQPTRIPAFVPSLQHKNLISLTAPLMTSGPWHFQKGHSLDSRIQVSGHIPLPRPRPQYMPSPHCSRTIFSACSFLIALRDIMI